ncbi:MAG: LAGLIDADG family homing endonuclease [archaeon]
MLGREVRTVFDRNRNCFGVSVESNTLVNFFQELEVNVGKKEELLVPDWIKNNENFSKAFIRGLFDTDGSISYKKNNTAKSNLHTVGVLSIVSTSKILITDVSFILSHLGLKHYVRIHKKSNGEKDAYRIDIYNPYLSKFMCVIGSHNPKHLTKFEIASKFGFCPPYTTPIQRKQILKGVLNPFSLYAGVP